MNRIVNWGIRLLFRHGYNDTTNAFKAYRREVIENAQPFLSHHFNLTVELPLKAVVRGYSYGDRADLLDQPHQRQLEAEAERDGQPLPVHRPLRLPRAPPEPRRLPEEGSLIGRGVAALRDPRVAWAVLGVAMLCSGGLILYAAHGQGFAIDELFYYGRVANEKGQLVHYAPFSPEYLLAPFNGHLPLGGRFVYELVFATAGAHYTVFVLINIAALWAVAALVFELARRRVGNAAALAPCIVLLFLGFAREQLLWPLDFNTAAALAAGLGAVLTIQREDRRGDVLACVLLVVSIAMIELGLAFALGIALWLVLSPAAARPPGCARSCAAPGSSRSRSSSTPPGTSGRASSGRPKRTPATSTCCRKPSCTAPPRRWAR